VVAIHRIKRLGVSGHESIAAFWHSFYVFDVCSTSGAERLTEDVDVVSEVDVFNKGVGPYLSHQGFFVDDLPGTPYQGDQNIQCFWRQMDSVIATQKDALLCVDSEPIESV